MSPLRYAVLLAAGCILLADASSAAAAYPGENGLIAFERLDGGQGNEIAAALSDGTGTQDLIDTAGSDQNPGWSPDGRRLAFNTNLGGNHDIYVIDADGSDMTNLTDHAAEDFDPAWSPDGQKIAFVSNRDGDNEIYVMDVEASEGGSVGGGLVQLTNNTENDQGPAWSPVGDRIAIQGALFQIDLIDADDGGNLVNLVDFDVFTENASWSPDGHQVAFNTAGSLSDDIWIVNTDGTGLQNLTSDATIDAGPAWSPDGEQIAYYSDSGKPQFQFDIWAMDADGGNRRRVTDTTAREFLPDWQPGVTPAAVAGDADCDGEVDAVDALHDLRYVAGLGASACIEAGNVKCDDAISAVDSLFILRHVALLQVSLPPGCPEIGT